MNDDVQHDYFQFRPDYPTDDSPERIATRRSYAVQADDEWRAHRQARKDTAS